MISLVVAGDKGRMGQTIKQMARNDEGRRFDPIVGFDQGDDPSVIRKADVVIDFTTPSATLEHLMLARDSKKCIIIGTTGFQIAEQKIINDAAKVIPIVQSSNMSLGVNVFFGAATTLARALPGYKVKIEETHHIHKKDKPSGTALQAGALIEKITQKPVSYESFREGEVVGDHRIIFEGAADRLELFHHAESRDIFVLGALTAAQWVFGKAPGHYSMNDVLAMQQ